jgi:hypothetical protein
MIPDKSHENITSRISLLLIISAATHFPFVLTWFGEMDATKIAVSVIDMIKHGTDSAFSNIYFTDVIPLYILYLKLSMKVFNYNYSLLPLIMNYTNAVAGILIVVPAFYVVNKIFRNPAVAFCSVLALLFTPSFYQATIMGFPHLISLFFLLISLLSYITGLDSSQRGTVNLMMIVSCVFLTIAFLFKADYVLAAGIYFGFVLMRKVRDWQKIAWSLIVVLVSSVLFLIFRNLILGPTGGTTMSADGMSNWFDFFFTGLGIITSPALFKYQITPIMYGAGIVTFFAGIAAMLYLLFSRNRDPLIFIFSWAAAPTFLWFIIGGNNARHNMLSVLPLLVIIIICLYKLSPRFVVISTLILILGNFFVTPPSSSITRPSGNLFKSLDYLERRMNVFHARAEEIADINKDKIAVLGYFHNPHVIFELLCSAPSYEAVKIGREDYIIRTGGREFVFLYIDRNQSIDDIIHKTINTYNLNDHILVSATYDLTPLEQRGFKTRTLDLIDTHL